MGHPSAGQIDELIQEQRLTRQLLTSILSLTKSFVETTTSLRICNALECGERVLNNTGYCEEHGR